MPVFGFEELIQVLVREFDCVKFDPIFEKMLQFSGVRKKTFPTYGEHCIYVTMSIPTETSKYEWSILVVDDWPSLEYTGISRMDIVNWSALPTGRQISELKLKLKPKILVEVSEEYYSKSYLSGCINNYGQDVRDYAQANDIERNLINNLVKTHLNRKIIGFARMLIDLHGPLLPPERSLTDLLNRRHPGLVDMWAEVAQPATTNQPITRFISTLKQKHMLDIGGNHTTFSPVNLFENLYYPKPEEFLSQKNKAYTPSSESISTDSNEAIDLRSMPSTSASYFAQEAEPGSTCSQSKGDLSPPPQKKRVLEKEELLEMLQEATDELSTLADFTTTYAEPESAQEDLSDSD